MHLGDLRYFQLDEFTDYRVRLARRAQAVKEPQFEAQVTSVSVELMDNSFLCCCYC